MKRVLFLLLVSVFMLPAFHSEAQEHKLRLIIRS